MQVKARYEEAFFRKFLYIALVCAAYSLWCLYDGIVKYPADLVRAKVYHEDMKDLDSAAREKAWLDRTTSEDWKPLVPDAPADIEQDISQQYMQIAVCLLIAIPMFLKYFLARGTYIEATDTEIRPSWLKTAIPFESITKIDKTRWKKKGIAKLYYSVGSVSKSFTLDDFKFAQTEMAMIMARAERDLPDSAIIGLRQGEEPAPESGSQNT
ncbi:MAG: hypothetical protein Q8M16_13880 [Pirellulaceae bacterium]|nr:hypothetical protein [Pirellulaceae bacterium]